jgi:hypothetical protein
MKDEKRGLEVVKGLSRWIEGLKWGETATKTHHGTQERENWKRMKECNMHKRECENMVTQRDRYPFYILHICFSMLILLYRCLASYSDAGSYCFAAATCGLSVSSELDDRRTVLFWCLYSVGLGTWSICFISCMVQTVIASFIKLTFIMCFPYSEWKIP